MITDRDLIAIIAEQMAPNPWFRQERRKRLGKKPDDAWRRDAEKIAAAERRAARILARLREAGAVRE
jgi:hypothetical protein